MSPGGENDSCTYLLWGHIKRHRPEVNLAIGVDARNHEENSGTSGTAFEEPTKPEYDNSLVLLHNLYAKEERYWKSDQQEQQRERSQKEGANVYRVVRSGCLYCIVNVSEGEVNK